MSWLPRCEAGWRTRRAELERIIRTHQRVVDGCVAELAIVDARIAEFAASELPQHGSSQSSMAGGGEAVVGRPVVESPPVAPRLEAS